MFFSRNDTASCRSPVRRWVCFTVEPAEILLVSQSETSSDFAEFPKSPSRVLGCGKWFLLRMSPLFSPLPPPGLWNMVRAQQILCNSFLGICQIPLPTKAGLMFYPLQNNPHVPPWFRTSLLSWYPPKSGWSGLLLNGFWCEELETEGSKTQESAVGRALALCTLWSLHLPLKGDSPFG